MVVYVSQWLCLCHNGCVCVRSDRMGSHFFYSYSEKVTPTPVRELIENFHSDSGLLHSENLQT